MLRTVIIFMSIKFFPLRIAHIRMQNTNLYILSKFVYA